MRLSVIGTGYVGLVAGAGFADFGNQVLCADVDEQKVARLQRGEIPIYEPGLEELVARAARLGTLRFTSDVSAAASEAEAIFIAVGTPPTPGGGADLSAVMAVADAVGATLKPGTVVVIKSTVPVGTAEEVRRRIASRTTHPFSIVSNPEFLKEGDAINDFMKPSRVVVGTTDERAVEVMRQLYAPFLRTGDRLHVMDPSSAELTKYAANALLAVRISFMNELAILAERVGADIESVRAGVGSDPRIGPRFLFAGPGYGGSCFPKDMKALLSTAARQEVRLDVVAAAERANERQKLVLPEKVERHFGRAGGSMRGKTIAVWGLAFKPGTDDVREAPALTLCERLIETGARVVAYDPVAMPNAQALLGERLTVAPGMYQAAEGAHALVLVTEWHEFRRPDFSRLRTLLREPVLFDGRNIWDPAEVRRLGFRYYGVGRQ